MGTLMPRLISQTFRRPGGEVSDDHADKWLDQVPTLGGHARLRPAQLSELLAGAGSVIDATGGSFTMGYAAVVVAVARAGAT